MPRKDIGARREYNRQWYERARETRRRAYEANCDARRAYQREYYRANVQGARARAYNLKRRFGMTIEQHDALFASQGSLCAICGSEEPRAKNWHTDHCHTTGKVRGILCGPCNHGLGLANDSPVVLEAMAAYLRRHAA